MHKARPLYFQGFEYVKLSQLPFDQAQMLRSCLPVTSYLKVDYEESTDCIYYDDYEYWYDNSFFQFEPYEMDF